MTEVELENNNLIDNIIKWIDSNKSLMTVNKGVLADFEMYDINAVTAKDLKDYLKQLKVKV